MKMVLADQLTPWHYKDFVTRLIREQDGNLAEASIGGAVRSPELRDLEVDIEGGIAITPSAAQRERSRRRNVVDEDRYLRVREKAERWGFIRGDRPASKPRPKVESLRAALARTKI